MFTGIVRAIALISKIEKLEAILRYAVAFPPPLLLDLQLGASVAIDGVCQTVVSIEGHLVWFEAIEETLNRTTLHLLHEGSAVNLERAAKFGDEIGGHLLSGHIFCTASLASIEKNIYTFAIPFTQYLFSKGYVAIDGMSLTVVDVNPIQGLFSVHLIPETLKNTTISQKTVGSLVNIEFDSMTQTIVDTIERNTKHS